MVMPTAYLFWTCDKDAAGKVIYFMCSASTKSFAKDNKKGFGTDCRISRQLSGISGTMR